MTIIEINWRVPGDFMQYYKEIVAVYLYFGLRN